GAECKVPRSLWVDKFTWHNGNGGIDLVNNILGNATKEDNLVDFAENHNITYLVLYGLNFVFDSIYQADPTTKQAKIDLSNFINKCYLASPRIAVGMVSTTKKVVWTNGIQYNIDVANNASTYNYNTNGKITYFVLEHEFWRADKINAFSGNTAFYIDINGDPHNHQEDGPLSTANDVPNGLLNDHFTNVWNDHKTILTNLKTNKDFDANVAGLHDYITFLFYNYVGANSSNDNSSTGHQISRAQFIESKANAIFFTYYRKYNTTDFGQNFLANYPYALDRLSFFGSQTNKTHIIPLFSGEIWDQNDPDKQCGEDASTDFLGSFLEDHPGYGTGTFKDAETTYQSQHQAVYNNTTTYPNIQNISVANFSWFKYKCLKEKMFIDNGLVDCESFNSVLALEEKNNDRRLTIFPNPTNGRFKIESSGTDEISSIQVYNNVGQIVDNLEPSEEYHLNLKTGIYVLIVFTREGSITSHKLSVQ
ncbi:MAG: T9SS type A sorting domain-containing protein, partial [Flavobacteriales bacterium]|nr:T9SS type A sorting domain-containing protein [Flavobacteriales bacterium]